MILIRNFGNDRSCTSVAEVLTTIQLYKGKSISIHDTRSGGRLLYVDVLDSGEIRSSYGDQRVIDLVVELDLQAASKV